MNKRIEVLRIINNIVILLSLNVLGIMSIGLGVKKEVVIVFLCITFVLVIITLVLERIRGILVFYPEISEAFFFIALYVFCRIAKIQQGVIIVLAGEAVWAILAVFYYNARQILDAMAPFKDGSSVPYDLVKKNNGRMMGISALTVAVSMFICSLLDYGKEIVSAIKYVTFRFFRWLFGFFKFKEQEEYVPLQESYSFGQRQSLLPEDYEDNSIWHSLWEILYWVLAAAVVIVVIVAFIRWIFGFYKALKNSKNVLKDKLLRDKVEYLSPFDHKENGRDVKRNESFLQMRLSNEGRIRLAFRKYIKNGSGYPDVKQCQTPSELEKTSKGKVSAAINIYEKARYSKHQITAEDLRLMKKAVK
ncbi:MAG: hypothetical protein J6O61_03270 [Butyrivibrio sp.]|uniref:hypothetical protein n=1 Tax=Butyrivibrio sp. TaxID=28121 RepID=UPI001B0D56BC|nr:hypothetical protein [Butyrivibrio sp.]MBO6239848.1 hypothetical protein [Butyrivibrio sp.]